jgi:NAD(P)-dependent dehydrogenase (short-subunit alcohol dehydrogenase family)
MYAVHIEDVRCTYTGQRKETGEMSTVKSVVVTGASTGIGWGSCKVLVEKGFRVFGSVRKQADADRLSEGIGPGFVPILMDVTKAEEVKAAAVQVGQALGKQRLFGLVNNAGVAVSGALLELPADELRRQMEVNVVGPLLVTQAFAPLLGSDPGREGPAGRIVQISSVGGKMGFPFIGAYIASKHALEGMSTVLRQELMLYGIDVIVIGPGAVNTAMIDKAEALDLSRFQGSDYAECAERVQSYFVNEGRAGLKPEVLGEAIWHSLAVGKPKARYAVVAGRLKNWTLPRLLPTRVVDGIVAKQFGLLRKH